MAAPGTQVVGKPVRGTGSSPKTPGNTGLVEAAGLPLQITPLESIETESTNPNTPHKDPALKTKSRKLVLKRKLFLQNGLGLQINKAKRHSAPKVTPLHAPPSRPTEAGPRVHYPLTERQQLQYLLEVTAKEAKQDSGSSSNDDLPFVSNKIKKKDISKDNHIEVRIRKRNERGETALHVAAIRGDLEDVVGLIKAGAMVNAKDNAGWTPLHEACNYGNLRIVQELVWSGADVNSPGYEAITPLHDAVINDHIQVVKFLLENGADPKLQTSQNYSTAELARSAAVLQLVSPERTTRDYYTAYSQESQPLPPPCQFDEPNFDLRGAKINGLNSSYSERRLYSGGFESVMHVDAKNDAPPVMSVEHSQNDEMCVNSQEDFGTGLGNCCDKQYFYDFPRNAHHFAGESVVNGSTDREDLSATLSSAEAVKRNNEGAERFEQPHFYVVDSTSMEPDGNYTQVVDKMNAAESSSENLVQNHIKECMSHIGCPDSLEESIATETLVQINSRDLSAKKPGVSVAAQNEEDTVTPEKLNECLDKAMIEISSYLETSQNFDVQTPHDERDLGKGEPGLFKNDKSLAEDSSFANDSSTPHRPVALPLETGLSIDYSQGDQRLAPVSQPGETELKTAESNAVDDLTSDETDFDRHQVVHFTKVKPRSEKRKEGMEKSGKTGRRKRSSTRSSESSKCDSNQSVVKEECTNHIPNVTWRSELSEYRYSVSAIPLRVPGYEDFLINSRNGSKSLLNEQSEDPSNANELDKLISQHDNEKVKLRMTLEQELVRLFGSLARKTAGYQVPYSACTVITSQMRPVGMKRVSVEDAQPAPIKIEVNKILNKFNRLKVEMLKRHNREIEVVIALGKFWTQKEELTGASRLPARLSTRTDAPTTYSEDFELLPAKFNEYYEEVLCATD